MVEDFAHQGPRSRPTSDTLASRLIDRDRGRFVGREAELAMLERCLLDDPPASVVLIHGPGGIGKSTLLRELARRAREHGREVFNVEGRELPPMPDALEAVLAGAWNVEAPLVLIDTYERMMALDGYLRRGLLPSLPARAVVVIAGRGAPDPAWFAGGWEGVAAELELHALAPDEALALLATHGLTDERAGAVVEVGRRLAAGAGAGGGHGRRRSRLEPGSRRGPAGDRAVADPQARADRDRERAAVGAGGRVDRDGDDGRAACRRAARQ